MRNARRSSRCLILTAAISVAAASGAPRASGAEDIVVENDLARLTLSTDGKAKALVQKPAGRQWLAEGGPAFSYVKRAGKVHDATRIERDGNDLRIGYGDSGVSARFRIATRPRYFVIELLDAAGEGVEELCLARLRPAIDENVGWWLDVRHNDQFAVCLLGLSDRVNTGGSRATVYAEFGMKGQRAALIAAPTARLLDVIQEVQRDWKLPSPTIGGVWAKRSPDIRRGYLFSDVTEANVEETIEHAKLGEFLYVMTYDGTWSKSLGSYPIHTGNFPRGEESLKGMVDKLHAAGLKAGLHMLTSFVGKNDPLVRPVPDARLLKDGRTTLAADVDEKAPELAVAEVPDAFPRQAAYYGSERQGFDLLVDSEIIRYSAVGGPDGRRLLGCTRAAHGTRPAAHKAGTAVHHLTERYGCYLADLRTTLKDELAERVAGVYNRCGFDMIYFDGGECNGANGPYWYWAGPQQVAIWSRMTRDCLVQGSGGTAWTWHLFSRGACDDFAAVAPKEYLDYHKIADSWVYYTTSFMPAELGWWGFLDYAPHQPATGPDEVECYAARMLALDTPVSLETNLAALKRNGRTKELLALLGRWERLRLSGAVPAATRQKLRGGEWHLAEIEGKPALLPVRYDTHRLAAGQTATATNGFGAQPLKFRLQAAPALAAPGDGANIILLAADAPLQVPPPDAKAPMPGALAGRVDLTKPANLLRHRALAVMVRVEAAPVAAEGPPAVLNIQLESGGHTYRDHYVDLDFTGDKTITIPEPNTRRMLPEFRPAHAAYPFKQAMYGFDYGRIVAVNFRWMRLPKATAAAGCAIRRVEALAESDVALASPQIAVGEARCKLPVELKTGDYAEFWADGPLRIFDRHGVSLRTIDPPPSVPRLPAGQCRIGLTADAASPVKLTLITTGEPLRW